MTELHVKQVGAIDLLSLGAMVHRLDTGIIPFRKATECDIYVSGGEFNVAANLADCFGLRAAVATAMVDYPIGHLITERVRSMGVRPFYKHFAHDGVTGPNMAAVYSDRGFGARAPVVFYNRSNEAAALLKPGDFDWDAIFAPGVRWFHSGGIFAALSTTTGELIIEAMAAAREHGAVTSFDLNYRPMLWNREGEASGSQDILRRIVASADVLVGNEKDLRLGLGLVEARDESRSGIQPGPAALMERVTAEYPRVSVVALTSREVLSTNRHRWQATARIDGRTLITPAAELDVYDRVGGGDGFAAGLFYGLLSGRDPDEALRLGWAHGALLTTTPGDTTMATLDQVEAFARGRSLHI